MSKVTYHYTSPNPDPSHEIISVVHWDQQTTRIVEANPNDRLIVHWYSTRDPEVSVEAHTRDDMVWIELDNFELLVGAKTARDIRDALNATDLCNCNQVRAARTDTLHV